MNDIESIMSRCTLCPRECGADRNSGHGFCGEGRTVRIARAALHQWEEPCISGSRGSGTVFFSGCTLRCVFCQNHEISQQGKGYAVTEQRLAEELLRLKELGAHNINLVNPTHFVPQILAALDICGERLGLPAVYNSGGYEKPETLESLRGRVSIFLPDLKYFSGELSRRYSAAEDYFPRTMAAIEKMVSLAGKPVIEDGLMKSGVIVRHLILPNHMHDSIALIERLAERFSPDEIMVSLMCQYTPVYRAGEFREIDRRLSGYEYKKVSEALEKAGFDGYVQERGSADEGFIPEFFDHDTRNDMT